MSSITINTGIYMERWMFNKFNSFIWGSDKQDIVFHVDLDEIIYRSAYLVEGYDSEERAISTFIKEIKSLGEFTKRHEVRYYTSCKRADSFRRRLCKTYKAHRDKRCAPRWFNTIKSFAMSFLHNVKTHSRLEADDLIGIAVTAKDDRFHIAVTQDKDIKTVPCLWVNPTKKTYGHTNVDEALYNLMVQVLTGDPADGYKGCPGVGPVKANKILGFETKNGWLKIARAYKKAGLTFKQFRMQYLLAKIVRRHIKCKS